MGKVGLVELHAKNSNSLEYVRAQVSINTEEPLQFRRTARFSSQTGEIQRGGRNKSSENREDKRKGKRVASSPQMVWKQKDGRGATKTSRSTGESTANQISSGEKNEQRSIMEKSKGSRDLAELKEAGSAFKRLGSSEKSGSGGSRG
ncbi:hypothetical protein F2Q68_00014158 [Brassica cretica]|uniref:Uncharacterized protein n=1 Tax=Brassica cretica TaxID=69181 RepID=A0A8S9HP87_BRACR|nr:hypothetical protein F2Q68_00014158 [Brassica cretica]